MAGRHWFISALLVLSSCGEDEPEEEPDEQDLSSEDEASEGKTDESPYTPTMFCLDNGSIPNGPNVGPAALGESVLGTGGRADCFGERHLGRRVRRGAEPQGRGRGSERDGDDRAR